MPQSYPFDEIPNSFGGIWKIITWECHLCKNNNWISDGNMRWKFNISEKCHTRDCGHLRCPDCYDCDEDDIRLQHCDGSILLNSLDDGEAGQTQEWTLAPGDMKQGFPCPLKTANGCDKVFPSSEHASRHAEIHNPVTPIPCPFQGCQRQFRREDDKDLHFETHTRVVPISCPITGCDLQFKTEDDKNTHLTSHFGYGGPNV